MDTIKIKAKFQEYPDYQDSGEYWMGLIPKHWEIKKLKHIFQEKKKVTNPNLSCGSISFGKVVYKADEKVTEATKASYQEVLAGEFLVNPLNLNYDLVSLRIGLSDINVVVSSGYIVLKNVINLDKSYFNYLLHRYDVAYMKLLGSGVRQTISFNHIANCLLAFPPLPEQTAIAAYLDDKTAKIDRAIAQKEKMIALLKERKQIIIQNAVTKGLDPNAKMKDSGVEWIGEIPEGWEVKKLKSFCKTYGRIGFRGYSTSDLVGKDEGAITISPSNIQGDFMNFEKCTYLSWTKYHESPEIQIFKNDVLIVKTGSTYGKVGIATNLETEATINPQLVVFKDVLIENEYFYEMLNSRQIQIQINKEVIGSTIPTISENKILNMKAGVPPTDEIPKIMNFVKDVKTKFIKAIKLQEQQIEKLKELKSTLIDSAVTGKIKVS